MAKEVILLKFEDLVGGIIPDLGILRESASAILDIPDSYAGIFNIKTISEILD